MTSEKFTSEVRPSSAGAEITVIDSAGRFALDKASVEGYVQLQDAYGRPMFDAAGRPMLVLWHKQRAHTPSATIALWIIAVLQVAAVIAGIVAAVALHDANSLGY